MSDPRRSGSTGAGCRVFSYRKKNRIKNPSGFYYLYKKGKKRNFGPFTVYYLDSATGVSRLGVSVSSKAMNAVGRNRVKRLARESFRKAKNAFIRPLDVVVAMFKRPGESDLIKEMEAAFQWLESLKE